MEIKALLAEDALEVWWDVPNTFSLSRETAAYDSHIYSALDNAEVTPPTFRRSRGLWPSGCSAVTYDYSDGKITFNVNEL